MTSPSPAAELDAAHVAWGKLPLLHRSTFGRFAVDYLHRLGLSVARAADHPAASAVENVAAHLDLLYPPLPESPFTTQALAMGVEDVADLLACLAERDLHWTPGEHGECGTLHEGQAEPPDLHVAFDAFRAVWQRDDARAAETNDPTRRWFGPWNSAMTWALLCRNNGPMTPEGGIAPTTPDEPDPS